MRTLDLPEAAEFLGLHPHTLQARAKAGEIPGAKVGKEWRFLDVDLAEYLRSQYRTQQPDKQQQGGGQWRSTGAALSGGASGASAVAELAKALARPTGKRRASTTTADVLRFGERKG